MISAARRSSAGSRAWTNPSGRLCIEHDERCGGMRIGVTAPVSRASSVTG